MSKTLPQKLNKNHPFAELLGLRILTCQAGYSELTLDVNERLFNPHQVLHGGAIYSMVDTGMGGALYTRLNKGQSCATIEIKINYFKPVSGGEVVCKSNIINQGRNIATLEAEVFNRGRLVAKAMGTYAIFKI